MSEHPEDEPRGEEPGAAAEPEPTPPSESTEAEQTPTPAAPEPVAEQAPAPAEPEPAEPEPVAEQAPDPAEPERVAEQAPAPAEPERVAEQAPAPAEPEPVAEQPIPADEPVIEADAVLEGEPPFEADAVIEDDDETEELAPVRRPEIPGADLVPDLVTDSEEFLDAEARAAAEAEAEAAAARAAAEEESDDHAQPIADAAIDLASGARYTATGKRKTAVARVILKPGTGVYTINGKELDVFFPRESLGRIIRQPLETVGYDSRMDVIARMHGGGVSAQAGALRHGISRALLEADPNLRGELKRRGFLTRDPRVKERKKAGLKKARKRPQFSKR